MGHRNASVGPLRKVTVERLMAFVMPVREHNGNDIPCYIDNSEAFVIAVWDYENQRWDIPDGVYSDVEEAKEAARRAHTAITDRLNLPLKP